MISIRFLSTAAVLLYAVPFCSASLGFQFHGHSRSTDSTTSGSARDLPIPSTLDEYETWTSPGGATVRYKTPGKDGICETTPGVNSYSGFIDVAPNVHVFFWFFDSRRDPATDDLTLWLNGGPGSDSLEGLFEELGPCRATEDLKTVINPYSFNNVSNLLFLSQPVGVGFSYQQIGPGSIGNVTATYLNATQATPNGVYPILDPVDKGTIDTTDLAAVAAWHLLQTLLKNLPHLSGDSATHPRNFNLWTESYGGHYGTSFYHYFQDQNSKLSNSSGYHLNFNTLGIFSGLIDEAIQAPWYPEFAMNNTYGIKAYNESFYNYARLALNMNNGCLSQIESCIAAASQINGGYANGRITAEASSNPSIAAKCSEAGNMCRDNVEGPYYNFPNGRGMYDIRHPANDPTPPKFYSQYLNLPSIRKALGVSTNYSITHDVYYEFQSTGDFIYPNFLQDLKDIVNSGVRMAMLNGDADYITNWFGGQAISLALNYTHSKEFAAQGYVPFVYGDTEYGETREYGNFSFTRVYEAGHEVPFYQPEAAFAAFSRAIAGLDMPQGTQKITPTLGSSGPPNATHTNSYVALPPTNSAALSSYSASEYEYYSSIDNEPVPTATPN